MNETIKLILSLSLSGSILAALIFALKPIIKDRLSKSIQYYLWIIVLLRLVIPFSFEGSLMNNVFYNDKTPAVITSQGTVNSASSKNENSVTIPAADVQGKIVDNSSNQVISLGDLFNQYAIYLWLLGAIISLAVSLIGYIKFNKSLKKSNVPAADEENIILNQLLNRRYNVKLVRNPFISTPMLIGILRPCIIIPDAEFNQVQLKNILLHEISHLKRFDIGVKWIAMIAAAIHWFNPLMYFIKREINRACELACDETVIKNLTPSEKQDYGDTLISVVAENKYPVKVLQATMCEEKKSLKERLIAIMNHNKKSKSILIVSTLLLGIVIICALSLGAGVGISSDTPPNIYIGTEGNTTKVALTGGYSWTNGNKHIEADSAHPANFKYKPDNIVSASGKEQLIISTQKLKKDKRYRFTIESIDVYKNGKPVKFETVDPSFMNGNLYIQGPPDDGEYVYAIRLNYKNKGTVTYGFKVRVNMMTYRLAEISKYKTPYIGNNSKVLGIVYQLPVPDTYFNQRYISMATKKRPYKLNVYYEAKKDGSHSSKWPVVGTNNKTYYNMQKNALVLFSMIGNLDEVTFRFRDSQSQGSLDESKYTTAFTFTRSSIANKYGDPSKLGNNLDLLQDVLTKN